MNAAGGPLRKLLDTARKSSQQLKTIIPTLKSITNKEKLQNKIAEIENPKVRKFIRKYRTTQNSVQRKFTYGGYLYAGIVIPLVAFGDISSEVMTVLSGTGYAFINIFTQQLTSQSTKIGLEIKSIKTLEATADYLEDAPDLHPEDYETRDVDKQVAQVLREQAAKLRTEQK